MFHEQISSKEVPESAASEEQSLSAITRIPSYVGVSCAVSGYRTLNKYDAVIRESLQAHNSPTRIALPQGPDGKTLHMSFDILNKELLELSKAASKQDQIAISDSSSDQENLLLQTNKNIHTSLLPNMNGHSNVSLQCTTRIVKVQKFSTLKADAGPLNGETPTILSNGSCEDSSNSTKSFVQQRIERLYGPGALGMAFRTRRAMLERQNDNCQEQENSFEGNESPPNLPSVFRHLRPEFRHQLPVKTKQGIGWNNKLSPENRNVINYKNDSSLINGNSVTELRVRHIPIQLEDNLLTRPVDVPDKKLNSNGVDIRVEDKFNCNLSHSKIPEKIEDQLKLDKINLRNIHSISDSHLEKSPKQEIKDGHYFLKVVDNVVSNLLPQVEMIEKDLENFGDSMAEDVKGKVLAATGKTKLLISQKIEQFKGLCHKNIVKSSLEEFPTTNEDLAGFWDMVHIQVDHIRDLLAEVELIKQNNWQDVPKTEINSLKKSVPKVSAGRKLKTSFPITSEEDRQKELAKLKANEERRKAMRDAINMKRKAVASKTNNTSGADQINFFVPTK